MLRNGLNLLSVSAFWQQVVIGVVIALAVLLDTRAPQGRGDPRRRPVPAASGDRRKQARDVRARRGRRRGRRRRRPPSCTAAPSAATSPKVGLSLSTLNNPFFVQIQAGAQAEAKKLGVDLTVTDAQNDASPAGQPAAELHQPGHRSRSSSTRSTPTRRARR